MRTLAPIRVRRCDCRGVSPTPAYACRICGFVACGFNWAGAMGFGLRHLRDRHPWPWAPAQLDIRDGSEA